MREVRERKCRRWSGGRVEVEMRWSGGGVEVEWSGGGVKVEWS